MKTLLFGAEERAISIHSAGLIQWPKYTKTAAFEIYTRVFIPRAIELSIVNPEV